MVKTLVGPNFNYGHHSIRLCLVVIAFLSVLSRKRCGAKSGLVVLVTTSPKLYLPTFCARKYSSYRHKSRLCMRKEHNITTPKIQRTMVSTRRSPEKEPPRRRPLDLSRRGQLRARQEREERRRRRMEASVAAVGAREEEPAPAPSPPPTPPPPQLLTQPPPPSGQSDSSAVAAAVDFANALDFSVAEEEEQEGEDEVEEEQGGGEQGGGDVLKLSRKSKLAMDDNELYTYFLNRLSEMSCPNRKCQCLAILQSNEHVRMSVAMYLSWFERRTKHEQDSIVFEWWRYVLILRPSMEQRQGKTRRKAFRSTAKRARLERGGFF